MTTIVRPDRVYRTGVLSPMVGYQPQMSVQAVAQRFTQGPPLGTTLQGLYGYHGLGGTGWDNFKAKVSAFFDRFRFKQAIAQAVADGRMTVVPTGSPGPTTMEASIVAPQMQSQMAMLAHLTQSQNSQIVGPLAQGMWSLQNRRAFSYYYAG